MFFKSSISLLIIILGTYSFASDQHLRVKEDLAKYDERIKEMKIDFSRNHPPQIENKEWVKIKLDHMVSMDQFMRGKMSLPHERQYTEEEKNYFWKEFSKRFASLDHENTENLKDILLHYNWITITDFGEKADNNAWLIAQHADNDRDFQIQVLSILEPLITTKETNPKNFAFLYDRVAVSWADPTKRRPQKYGTQGMCTGPGTWEPMEIEDPKNVDTRRVSVGLPSLEEYKEKFKDICK